MRIQIISILLFASVSLTGQGIMLAGGAVAEEPGGFVPTDVADCVAWYDASDTNADGIESGVSEQVSPWVNKATTDSNGENLTGYNTPTLTTLNNKNSIYLDGVNQYYAASTASDWNFLHNGTSYTVFFVVKAEGTDINNALYSTYGSSSGENGSYLISRDASTNQSILFRVINNGSYPVNIITASGTWPINNTYYFRLEVDPDRSILADRFEVFRNGTDLEADNTSSGSVTTNNASYPLHIGIRAGINDLAYKGYISELIFYDRALTGEEKTNIETYLSTKYGF